MAFRKASAFGMDIGDASIKVLQFRTGGIPSLNGFAEVALPAGIVVAGEIKEPGKLAGYIKTAVKTARISSEHVVGALPESKTFLKILSIPFQESLPWRARVEGELQKHIPYELSEIWWDAVVVEETPTITKTLVGVTPKTLVSAYTAAISTAGLTTVILDLEALAIARAVIPQTRPEGCVLIIDIGATKSTMLITTAKTAITTADARSASTTLTAQIAESLHLEIPEAEKMKITNGLKAGAQDYRAVVEDYTRTLSARIRAFLALTLTQEFCPAITEIILTGGGALLSRLPEALTQNLSLPARLANPWINVKNNFKSPLTLENALPYTTACGLALSALHYEHF